MNNRAYAVDILRGLAIVGMVLSGYIAWNPDLPAWLFHAQLPPPSFVFDASVAGITWVDLVFPFFLFSMGAAFPLSLGRRLNRPEHYEAVRGQKVSVKLYRANENGVKEFSGILTSREGNTITLEGPAGPMQFELSAVSTVRLCDDEDLFD